MDEATLAQFKVMLDGLMSADNNIRGQAEAAFNNSKSNPDMLVTGLLTILSSGEEQGRAMCALLLRKTVMASQSQPGASLVKSLSPTVAAQLKTVPLECIANEPQRHIRKKVCDAVGQLGIGIMSENLQAWPELFPWMLTATRSGNANMHEAALTIFNSFSDLMAEKMKPMLPTLHEVFTLSLREDQAMIVRIAALKTLASLLLALQDGASRNAFQSLIPAMLQTISSALQANDEGEVRSALEVFVEIAESQPKFLKKSVVPCVEGMIQIASNSDLEDPTRHLALEFLLTVAENAPVTACKFDPPGFCHAVVPVALKMMLEIECDTAEELAEWEAQEEDDEDTEITNYDVGEEALDRLAIALGGKDMHGGTPMVDVLFGHIRELLKSPDWKQRHAALMAISQSGEGCEKQMKKQLEQIVHSIVAHFGDAHPRVKWAAINTVGQMCTDFGPELQNKLHALVLPALITTMDDGCRRVQAHAAAAIINFCEHCARSTLQQYLPALLGKLSALLQGNVRRVAEQAVTAIASVADVAEDDFKPYYPSFMPGLKMILQQSAGQKDYRMLRGKSMECISLIGVAVGKEVFANDAKEVMEMVVQTQQGVELEPDDPQISFMLQACGRICKCLGEQFQPYLPFVIPPLIKSANIDPELHVTDADDDVDDEQEEGMESVTVAIRGQGHKRITIRTSALEEKATACSMLHTYAKELGEGFLPYVQEVAKTLVPLIRFQYMDDVRTGAMAAMPELLNCAVKACQKGVAGATLELVTQLKDFMFAPVLEQLRNEPDTETLAQLLDSWNEVIACGSECPAARLTAEQMAEAMARNAEMLQESIKRREERKTADEEEADDYDEEQLEEEMEREEVLVQNVVESIGALFKVYSSAVLPLFQQHLLAIFQAMLQPNAITTDRVAALCVFDDIIEHCSADGAADVYVPTLLPAFLAYAKAEENEVRQAAVYGLGVLAAHSRAAGFGEAQMQQAAQTLGSVVQDPQAFSEDNASASDNAVSALGKLCTRSEAIAQVCRPMWLQCLPLKCDQEEARAVHRSLVELCETMDTHVLGESHAKLPTIIVIFGQVLGTELVDDETAARIKNLLVQVRNGLPQVLQALPQNPGFAQLTEEQRGELERAISGS